MLNSVFVEPEASFNERRTRVETDPFAFTKADPHIINLLRAGPERLTTILNKVGRILPSASKKERVEIMRRTLNRIGELIRLGRLRRIKRFYVATVGNMQNGRNVV